MQTKLTTKTASGEFYPASGARSEVSSLPIAINQQRSSRRMCAQRPVRRKATDRLTAQQIVNVLAALGHAEHVGCPPTHLITIDWQLAGVVDSIAATGRFLKQLKQAAASRGWPTMHIWVREVGPVVGDHVHILIHLPYGANGWLTRLKPGWLKRCGAQRQRGVSATRRVIGRPLSPTPFEPMSDLYRANLKRLICYVVKHCDPTVAALFGINSKGVCTVTGKRVSVSQNLSWKARKGCQACSDSGEL